MHVLHKGYLWLEASVGEQTSCKFAATYLDHNYSANSRPLKHQRE